MTIASVLPLLERAKRAGKGYQARCPAHDDQNPSLSVWEGSMRLQFHCHAGCDEAAVLRALGLELKDLFYSERQPAASGKSSEWGTVVATYLYEDADGVPRHFVERTSTKQFPQGRIVNGKKVKGLNGEKVGLYHLPELLAAPLDQTVYIAEGEKDVERLRKAGFVATCNPGGAGKFRADHAEVLRGRPCVLVMDKDEAGEKHVRGVRGHLEGLAASVAVVEAKTGKDAFDHLEAGHGVEDFVPVELDGQDEQVSADEPGQEFRTLAEIEAEAIEWLWHPYVPLGEVTVLAGDGGVGKSMIALSIAATLSIGLTPFTLAECAPCHVLFVTAEDDAARTLKPRASHYELDETRIHVLDCGLGMSADKWIEKVTAACKEFGAKLVVIDPLQAFSDGRDLNKLHEARAAMATFHRLARETGCAVLIISHFNKGTGGKAQYRVNGSADIVNAARSALIAGVVERDGDEIKVMAHVKSNYAPRGATISFSTDNGAMRWGATVPVTAEDISVGKVQSNKREEAADFLRGALAGEPVKQVDIEARAKELGISSSTLRRAKGLLGVKASRDYGVWWWSLPSSGLPQGDQDAQESVSGNVEHLEHVAPTLNLKSAVQDAQTVIAAGERNLFNDSEEVA